MGDYLNRPKLLMTHDAIIDYVIANPTASYREIAMVFSYTPEGIGIICRSDAFQARYQVRRDELVDPLIQKNVESRLQGLAHASLDILQEKLKDTSDPNLALKTLDLATRASQYGARGPQGGTTFVVQLPGPATNSEEWSLKFGRPAAVEIIENASFEG